MNKYLAGTAWIVLVGAVSYHFISQYPRPMADAEANVNVERYIGHARHGTLPVIIEPSFGKTVRVVLPKTRSSEVGCVIEGRRKLRRTARVKHGKKKVVAHSAKHRKHHRHKASAHHHHPKPKYHGGHHHHTGGHGAHHGGHTGGHHHHTPPPYPRC